MAEASRSEILQLAKEMDEQLKLHGLTMRMVDGHCRIDQIDDGIEGELSPAEFNRQLQLNHAYVAVSMSPERHVAIEDYRQLNDPKVRATLIEAFGNLD